jgi:myosin-crossreactive antigen
VCLWQFTIINGDYSETGNVSSGTLLATRSSAWIFSLVHARFAAINLELDQQVIFWTYKACEAGTSICEGLK